MARTRLLGTDGRDGSVYQGIEAITRSGGPTTCDEREDYNEQGNRNPKRTIQAARGPSQPGTSPVART